ncbi:MAG: hypothetical protein JO276_12730 [Sphingomonadaceae bacterium]|nr:hypothetical protein [Sphingomonadaceae bacterium]
MHWVPSLTLQEDEPDDATHDGMALALPGAVLRTAPSDRARILARLRWDVMGHAPDDRGRGAWAHAWIAGNREGWVRRDRIRAFTAYSAIFRKAHGRWLLAGFASRE